MACFFILEGAGWKRENGYVVAEVARRSFMNTHLYSEFLCLVCEPTIKHWWGKKSGWDAEAPDEEDLGWRDLGTP